MINKDIIEILRDYPDELGAYLRFAISQETASTNLAEIQMITQLAKDGFIEMSKAAKVANLLADTFLKVNGIA